MRFFEELGIWIIILVLTMIGYSLQVTKNPKNSVFPKESILAIVCRRQFQRDRSEASSELQGGSHRQLSKRLGDQRSFYRRFPRLTGNIPSSLSQKSEGKPHRGKYPPSWWFSPRWNWTPIMPYYYFSPWWSYPYPYNQVCDSFARRSCEDSWYPRPCYRRFYQNCIQGSIG